MPGSVLVASDAREPTALRAARLLRDGCYNCHSQRDPFHGFAFVGARFTGNPDADPDPMDVAYEIAAPNLTPASYGVERYDATSTAFRRYRSSSVSRCGITASTCAPPSMAS